MRPMRGGGWSLAGLGAAMAVAAALSACGGPEDAPATRAGPPPAYVTVDHILVGVRCPHFPQGRRPVEQARAFAQELLAKLRAGAAWDELKRAHSEDPPPGGPYTLADHGRRPRTTQEYPRGGMAPAFGDVAFSLGIGEIGLAEYDPSRSPYGYHVIKRLR